MKEKNEKITGGKKLKKVTLVLLMAAVMILLCSCMVKDGNSDKKGNDGKSNEVKVDRKVPESMEELNVEYADTIRQIGVENEEWYITDNNDIEIIKKIISKARIRDNIIDSSYRGSVNLEIYNGDELLCSVYTVETDGTEKLKFFNDEYEFIGEISSEDADEIREILWKYQSFDKEDRINFERKAPNSVDELGIQSADSIKWMRFDEKEIDITDEKEINVVKNIIVNSNICEESSYELLTGGLFFGLYKGDEALCYINMAVSADTGCLLITNDNYEFLGEISEEDIKKIYNIIGKYNEISLDD